MGRHLMTPGMDFAHEPGQTLRDPAQYKKGGFGGELVTWVYLVCLVRLVYLVCLVRLVYLVCLVYLGCLGWLGVANTGADNGIIL